MSLSEWIPDGVLPRWLLVVAAMAHLNGANNFIKPSFSAKVYSTAGTQITPLSARLFGVWNFTSAIIRGYAAYNIHDKVAYELCMWSFVIALAHFISETLVYKTAKLGPGMISPLIVASSSLTAMYLQYGSYVHKSLI
ncbi:related to ERG28-involved in synthesis of ergosterol [Sporisorium reilianum SRZ2]|uniref:Related to ERG28-involved in synthesis of ergosterol n=2 Tax=Sporisorium reilianum TaxID=72558 RepID=E6ZXQ3_SPORE|nr:related to ERG28-involved in synthesis of ergosterol [Sporisorium reilianum SRZ2]SJX61883.1 related to ERG28-involved in synthesis of ergosterol [Sporisorium reilianum f. sp. reilianum]